MLLHLVEDLIEELGSVDPVFWDFPDFPGQDLKIKTLGDGIGAHIIEHLKRHIRPETLTITRQGKKELPLYALFAFGSLAPGLMSSMIEVMMSLRRP